MKQVGARGGDAAGHRQVKLGPSSARSAVWSELAGEPGGLRALCFSKTGGHVVETLVDNIDCPGQVSLLVCRDPRIPGTLAQLTAH